ncbi:MAG TPA: hypothetical protein VK832_10860 [Burkholderiaceae bacterium]|jgi:hypothetical protein|nr:hypothetical protein [Burkholderiaceae bacterium]
MHIPTIPPKNHFSERYAAQGGATRRFSQNRFKPFSAATFSTIELRPGYQAKRLARLERQARAAALKPSPVRCSPTAVLRMRLAIRPLPALLITALTIPYAGTKLKKQILKKGVAHRKIRSDLKKTHDPPNQI